MLGVTLLAQNVVVGAKAMTAGLPLTGGAGPAGRGRAGRW
jgi:hypothetical protein